MNWQTPIALGLVAATAALFAWRRWRPRRLGRSTGGCCSTNPPGTKPQGLVVSGRRGQPPTVTFKT